MITEAEAIEALERHRAEVHAIKGVIGSGVGLNEFDYVAVQVFVQSGQDVVDTWERLRELPELWSAVDLDVIVGPAPDATETK